ncbi:MAG: hypothetical protein ABIQ18_07415, partial [Umezawaea sp.]
HPVRRATRPAPRRLMRRLGLGAPDRRWLNVDEIRAEGPGAGRDGGRVTLSGQTLTARRASTVR